MTLPFLDKRFVIVAGKGGVGKSTLCAALGLLAAKAGKRTIVAELNTKEKVPHFFGKPDSGYNAQEVRENLYSINIQPEPALHEYGLQKLKFERVYKLVFENEAMQRLIRMIPGMSELFLLGKAFDLERSRTRTGTPAWDLVIVDAPATGHGVSLLRLPQVILEVSSTGPMADEVRLMRDLLSDPRRTMINIACLPEEMPVKETLMLAEQVESILKIPTGFLFMNGLLPEVENDEERAWSAALRSDTEDPVVLRALDCLDGMARRQALQESYVELLREKTRMPLVEIPYLFQRDFGVEALEAIGAVLEKAMVAEAAATAGAG
ncbi:MAG: ArsA family ATPase [Myxococcales bacterium]|nr:ArsA family ATPase [Myxococcales bacterium]